MILSGPTLTAQLPMQWCQSLPPAAASDWEMLRYLMVLADFEQPAAPIELAQAKQDLQLLWLARQQEAALPAAQTVQLGMQAIVWTSQTATPQPGATGYVALALSTHFPRLLHLPATITAVAANPAGGQWVRAEWQLAGPLQDQFETTVFRYHRRAISNARQGQV